MTADRAGDSQPPAGRDPLAELAGGYGVATSYDNWAHQPVEVAPETVVAVLAALGVDASTPDAARGALAELRDRQARRLLPPAVVRAADDPGPVPVADRSRSARVILEDGAERPARCAGGAVTLAADLPLGWHRLLVADDSGEQSAALVLHPGRITMAGRAERAWGWMLQLYSVRSAGSWGMGDYADLREIVGWSGAERGGSAGLALCNPLHAVTPVPPIENSPYYPSSRRFRSALYLRPEETPEYAAAGAETRAAVDRLRPPWHDDRIDRDEVWGAKLAALELLWPLARRDAITSFLDAQGGERGGLADFALFCALAERHGPRWPDWPKPLHDPHGPGAQRARTEHADRVAFHIWLQLLCDEQLASADATARAAGMPIGIVHDLAVGVDPGGADGWALQDVLVRAATVGAPPDSFNQLGQDWQLPPWHPHRLAEAGYSPFGDMVRSVLRHAGGIRIDHVMGLFRLWWVPRGNTADGGSYVRYDADALLGVLALEAHRAGAVVVGEDLGTVEPAVTEALERFGVFGSEVAWFVKDEETERFLPPKRWRTLAMASVTTHDLPTVHGWLTDEPIRVRAELQQLGVPVEEEQARMAAERSALLELLRDEGLLESTGEPGWRELTLALHALLVAAPSRLVLAAFGDAVGDLRQPNLPGTRDEYPNWRLPVTDAQGRSQTLEQLIQHPDVARLTDVLRAVRPADHQR